MRSLRTVCLLAVASLAGGLPVAAAGPLAHAVTQDGRDPAKAIASFQRYLERKPYHDWAFDQMVDAAVGVNRLGALVEDYTARLAEDPGSLASRVVLARLLARTDQLDEALETLAAVAEPSAELHRLVGRLQLRAGRWDEAVAALDRAVEATDDPEVLESIHKERGQAHLAAGDRERAAEAFRALAAIDPRSFHLRLEAATELAWHGLAEEALEELAVADQLAGDDASKRCRVLSEIGRLHERLGQGDQAVATYRQALALLARGHWLKRDLHDRILAVHQRAGTVDQLIEACRADAADASDLDARELLARTLVLAERREEARDVLSAATADFPSDLELSERLLEVLEALGDDDGRIAEYQRVLGERPEELELYLELGRVFASSGRFEQARRQWNATLEQRLDDAGLCVRLAGMYALFDQLDDARAMYEKAIALEPRDVRHYADLAAFLAVRGLRDEVPAVLERADAAARDGGISGGGGAPGGAGRMSEVASLWSEYGQPERARGALEAALALDPDDAQLKSRLADALLREGSIEQAADILHEVVETAREAALRNSAVDRIVRQFSRAERLEELLALETAAAEERPEALAPRLVLGKLHVQRREPDLAIGVYEDLLERAPDSEDARKALARLYEEAGDPASALEQYEALIEARPQTRRTYLKEIARIHLARYDQERAFECYDEILRGAPDNAAAFREVADAYDKLGLHDKRLECLQQAARLAPEDARTRLALADAWRTLGEWDRAREEIAEASRVASDEDLRDDARQRLYVLLSETGRLEEEVDRLRRRVDENPYDTESPLVLTDVYVRELEYELALEMLDRLLTYQPKEPKLLSERARLLRLMDRHEEAIADYETLWKLPDVDRHELALDLGEAAIEAGDLERAAKVLAGVSDHQRVANLYRRHDLYDQAVRELEQGVAGSPGDGRLLLSLSRVQEQLGDREAAAATLGRLLALRGDSWRVLVKLGELRHDLGQRDEALAIGQRLFAMLRVEEVVEDEEEEQRQGDPWAARSYQRWFSAGQQYASRLSALQSFFQSKGWTQEYLTIGLSEMALQPTNDTLYSNLLNLLRREGGREAEARDLVRSVRAAALERGRCPAGSTHDDWLRRLDADETRVFAQSSALAEERAAELAALVDAGQATERDWRELAQLQGTLQHDAERLATLEAAVAALPGSIPLRAGLASVLTSERRHAEALPHYERLVALLEESDWLERERARLDHSFDQQRRDLLQQFPLHVQSRVDDAALRRLFDVTYGPSTGLGWALGSDPSLAGARMAHARCLQKLERQQEARAALVALEPENPEDLRRWSSLAGLYYAEELWDEARAVYERMLDVQARLEDDPLLGHVRPWERYLASAMKSYARLLEREGDVPEAYHLLRTWGHTQEGELLLTTHEAFDAAEARYRAEREAAAATLDQGAEGADLAAWREASVRLADVLQFTKRWDQVAALYQELAARLPDDFSVLEQVAALHLRAGRFDEAIATRYAIIDRKRELNRRMERDLAPPGRVLDPVPPQSAQQIDPNLGYMSSVRVVSGFSGQIYYAGGYGGTSSSQRGLGGLYDIKPDYTAILQLYLDRREPQRAAEVLAQLAREDATTFRYMGWEVRELIERHQLGSDALPLLRQLHGYQPTDDDTALAYGRALVQADRLEEAHKVLSRVANRGRPGYYSTSQARLELDRLEARMGLGEEVTLEALAAEVAGDPKNVKRRMKLARALFRERRFEEALEHGLAAEELAPHQDEVAKFVTDALTVLGREEQLEERLRRRLDEEQHSEQRFATAVRLADRMADRGEEPAAIDALFERVVEHRYGGSLEYAPSSWWLERDDLPRARERLEAEIERAGRDSGTSADARARLAYLDLAANDPRRALEETFEQLEEAADRAGKLAAFGRLAGVLRRVPDRDAVRPATDALAAEWGGARAALLPPAAALALGELEAFEAGVRALLDEGEAYLYLAPALADLALQRGDREAALAELRALEARGVVSKSRRVRGPLGYVDEVVALRAAIGSLLFELGREDEARAVWAELYPPEERESARSVMATLYELHDLHAEALAPLREMIEEEDGAKNAATLRRAAALERELENLDEAIRLTERAVVLAGHAASERLALAALHRERGTLPEHFEELLAVSEADPNDAELARVVVQLAVELGRDEVAQQTIERLADRPEQAVVLEPWLLRMKLLRGDEEGAFATYERLLAGGQQEYYRQRYSQQLAQGLARRGEHERAEAVLRRAFDDPDGAAAEGAVAQLWERTGRLEEALAAAERARELDPHALEPEQLLVTLHVRLDQPQEALAVAFEALEDPALANARATFREHVPHLAERTGAEARLVAARAEQPEDPSPAYRLGLVRATQHRYEEALEPLEAALTLEPEHHGALAELAAVRQRLGRYAEAEGALRTLVTRLDREQGLPAESWRARNDIAEVVGAMRELRLLRGDRGGALAIGEEGLGSRYRPVEAYRYSYYNNPRQDDYRETYWLQSHGFHAELIEQMRLSMGLDRYNRDYRQNQLATARLAADDPDLAEDLWRAVAEPGRDLVQEPQFGDRVYFSSSQGDDPRWWTLYSAFRNTGRTEELVQRARAELAAWPRDPVMRPLLILVLQREERWEELAELRREDLEHDPDDRAVQLDLGRALRALGRHEEALALFEDVHRALLASLPQGGQEYVERDASGARRGTPGKLRFAWSGSQSRSSSYYSYSSEPGVEPSAEETGVRRELMALYARLGRRDEARELEAVERSMALLRTWYAERVPLDLARAYGELGLLEDAERLALEALEGDEDLTASACTTMVTMAREHGDEARRRAWAERWAAHLDEEVAREPFSSARRLTRARVRLDELGELEGAREDVEQVLAWNPDEADARQLAAWIALESGDATGALEGFRSAEPLTWATGEGGPGERGAVGLALARAAVEGPEAAREALQRALWRWPASHYKERLEELLQ